jgi:hypothetical protein
LFEQEQIKRAGFHQEKMLSLMKIRKPVKKNKKINLVKLYVSSLSTNKYTVKICCSKKKYFANKIYKTQV